MGDRWVCLDVGETLVDETRVWLDWSDLLDVTPFSLLAAIGATVAQHDEHQSAFDLVRRPGWRDHLPAFRARYGAFRAEDLYPDAARAIERLRESGYRIAIVANQPAERTEELRALGIEAEVMAMSAEIGLSKPDPRFFVRALELMGNPDPADVAYVGDRLDNDVRPSLRAGMRAVWLRRGPWGMIGDENGPPDETALVVHSLDELAARIDDVWRHTDAVGAEAAGAAAGGDVPGTTAPRQVLQLSVIGAAPAWSLNPGNPSSCYLVELGGEALVLDLGQGSMSHLAARRPLDSIAAVLISHLHADHHVDLVPLRHYLKFGLGHPSSVELRAPQGLRTRYDAFLGEEGFLRSIRGDDVAEGTTEIGPFAVVARPVTHAPNAFAFRVSPRQHPDAAGLVYSGDCGRWQDLVPLIRPGDTLLSEAFWGVVPAEADEMHLPAADAARAAREGGARHLILTHIADSQDLEACCAEAATIFDGRIDAARPGLSVRIG